METFAIVPYPKYRSMEQRIKKVETSELPPPNEPPPEQMDDQPSPQSSPLPPESGKKRDKVKTYRTVQVRKLLQYIKRMDNSQDITTLENLDELIKSALGGSRRILENEEKFFNFLFENNLAHFVKNRSKINIYYKAHDNWYEIG